MLGVQRTSVTLSAQTLHEAGLIEYKRGKARQNTPCECRSSARGCLRMLPSGERSV
ncbi:hypothetical protein ACRQ5Q_17690 [Bradyrhizobium sp. PMVTL-01]|uniref:hypothetical protein n=1 Tax=Bradyrhizobium sp. PMVTL-01 TaxID=3434999 RepID=UPI003F716A6D